MTRELDELDAIHRDATSLPWDDEWEIVEEPDEHGYYPQREVRAEKDGQSIATFAYLQHLQLFLAALRLPKLTDELRRLRDLADATRRVLQVDDRDVAECGECLSFSEHFAHLWNDMQAALARLDGEDTG